MSDEHLPPPLQRPVRRIVTGHDAQGRSIVTEDRNAPSVHTNPKRRGYHLTQLWATDQTPAVNSASPTTKIRLRPTASPSRPKGRRRSVSVSR